MLPPGHVKLGKPHRNPGLVQQGIDEWQWINKGLVDGNETLVAAGPKQMHKEPFVSRAKPRDAA